MIEYARKPGRGQNDELGEIYRAVCRVFETRKVCEKCWRAPIKYVQLNGAKVAQGFTALCESCNQAARKLKTTQRVTLAAANQRLREIETSDRVTLPAMTNRLREIESSK